MKNNRLRDLREDKDLTQKQVADEFFLQVTQYRRYENGNTDIPLEWAKKFARFYNVSIDYIANLIPTSQKLYSREIDEEDVKLLLKFKNAPDNVQQAIKMLLDL